MMTDAESVTNVKIADCNWEDFQLRYKLDEELVEEYAAAMAAGEFFPPIVGFSQTGGAPVFVPDGAHRVEACKKLGVDAIRCHLCVGSQADALSYAFQEANTRNGARLTNLDKRHKAKRCHQVHPDWSINRIADYCKVSSSLVRAAIGAPAPSELKRQAKQQSEASENTPQSGGPIVEQRFSGEELPKNSPAEKPKKPAQAVRNGQPVADPQLRHDLRAVYGKLCRLLDAAGKKESLLDPLDEIASVIEEV